MQRCRPTSIFCAAAAVLGVAGAVHAQLPINSTLNDFYLPGSQRGLLDPNTSPHDPIFSATICANCHTDSGNNDSVDIYRHWSGSMMAQAARDPVFHACLQIANGVQVGPTLVGGDAVNVGDLCLRCHTPSGWLEGRTTPTDGSGLNMSTDREGISCHFCHRQVAIAPQPDECNLIGGTCIDQNVRQALLADGDLPTQVGSARYVIDTQDNRRGPFEDAICDFFHTKEVRRDYFRNSSQLCASCHDVSNPMFTKSGADYVLTPLDQEHPTGNQYDMFPLERTYSEWLNSAYATPGGVDSGGRFGGNFPIVGSCTSCHHPLGAGGNVELIACIFGFLGAPLRLDSPMHYWLGANTWVPDVIVNLYPAEVDAGALAEAKTRNIAFLQAAATLQLSMPDPADLRTRVINETGHKLPTGFAEGRRMWLNVVVRDCTGAVLAEFGAYDSGTAVLTTGDTKVYEIKQGIDAAVAAATGLPVGESFHIALSNTIEKDNRIPPRGFTNAAFTAVQAQPVAYSYPDAQYWDDTLYTLPGYADSAEVRLYYQTASKEYIDFLRDENPLPPMDPNNMGQIVHNQWSITGKSPPVLMASGTLNVRLAGDVNGDRQVSAADVAPFVDILLGMPASACPTDTADMNTSGMVDGDDIEPFVQQVIP